MGERSSPEAFQWSTASAVSSRSTRPMISSRVRQPSAARYSLTSSAMNSKKFTTNSGLPVKRLRSSGFWVATPTGQVSRWHTRIITHPETTSGAVAQAVEQERLLGLGQAELPRRPCVLDRLERRGAGPAVVAGDQHDIRLGLAHAGGDGPDADLRHQLHVHARP